MQTTDQWSADERCGHAAETGAHRCRADTDVANFGWKEFVGEHVQNRVSDADERLAKHREDDRRRAVTCSKRLQSCIAGFTRCAPLDFSKLPARHVSGSFYGSGCMTFNFPACPIIISVKTNFSDASTVPL